MKPAHAILILTGLVFGFFGLAFLLWPELVGAVGVELPLPSARTEIRAFYGGWQIGFAAFLLWCARRQVELGLRAGCISLAAIATARVFGMLVDGDASALLLLLLAAETAGAIVCGWALKPASTLHDQRL